MLISEKILWRLKEIEKVLDGLVCILALVLGITLIVAASLLVFVGITKVIQIAFWG